ncbi:acyl-CoA thioesterase [Iodobacter ciconiae]|uniref:Thioesterase n=1 Tax=Iodobacter ciconiae TaxID=2496266 RepID=A0A3S8ZRG6_9NEIS|nr:thioesterase family protein [Iodobacter ciconiae]AZN36011.1 thioesterase [Iodobacter ciconiae]
MPRLKLMLPEGADFTTRLDVRVTDLNYGNHLANQALLGMLHEARLRFLTHLNHTELGNTTQPGIILADVEIQFRREAFLGDQLNITLFVDQLSHIGFDLYYRVSHAIDQTEIALAKTSIVFFDYHTTRKRAPAPASFEHALKELKEKNEKIREQ